MRRDDLAATRTIALDSTKQWVIVQHLESVRFDDGGQSFQWQAGAPADFP
jgi:hypothetical protein